MSPAGAIGVNVAIATAAVAAQVLYPRLGHGPISHEDLHAVQRLREADVRTLHRLQLGAQRVLLGQARRNPDREVAPAQAVAARAALAALAEGPAPAVLRRATSAAGSSLHLPEAGRPGPRSGGTSRIDVFVDLARGRVGRRQRELHAADRSPLHVGGLDALETLASASRWAVSRPASVRSGSCWLIHSFSSSRVRYSRLTSPTWWP
jgi:hypothetical protein